MDEPWRDIIQEQPEQHQRILGKFKVGAPRIVSYNKYCWELWGMTQWKPVPQRTS